MNSLPVIKSKLTYLEMIENPNISKSNLSDFEVKHIPKPDYDFYINLYRNIGRDYIWNYRPGQSKQEVTDLISSNGNHLYILFKDSTPVGMAEIDINDKDNVEIIHFGLIPEYTNQGIGKLFFKDILNKVWVNNPKRVWLVTCELDHSKAISFYEGAGFSVCKTEIGDFYNYRYTDFYELTDAPQIPLSR